MTKTQGDATKRRTNILGEFDLISALTENLSLSDESIVRGIGDDAAAVDTDDRLSLVTCDSQVDGVHFLSDKFEPEEVGRRAAAVNLSDIAAMGGIPRYAVVSLLVPQKLDQVWIQSMYRGLALELATGGATIIGGNIASTTSDTAIDMTLIGAVPRENMLCRTGASPGDILCVTGHLGASFAGLKLLKENRPELSLDTEVRDFVQGRYKTPTARLREGRILGEDRLASACIDISDGLLQDAGHLAQSSGVSIEIDADKLPVAPQTKRVAEAFGSDVREWALGGGEDFELLFTVRPDNLKALAASMAGSRGIQITQIGKVVRGEAQARAFRGGEELVPTRSGFDHMKRGE